MQKSVPTRLLGAKSGSPLEKLANMKSDKVDSADKVALRPTPPTAKTDSPVGKKETAHVDMRNLLSLLLGRLLRSMHFFKPDLLEDIDVCAKFVDAVRGVVCPSSFAKHTTKYMKIALLAMMQKTTILAAGSMLLDQKDTNAAKEVAKAMVAETYSSAEKIKRLEYELVALKGFNISASTSLQLQTACQEIVDLKTRLDAIQVKYESAEKEIGLSLIHI